MARGEKPTALLICPSLAGLQEPPTQWGAREEGTAPGLRGKPCPAPPPPPALLPSWAVRAAEALTYNSRFLSSMSDFCLFWLGGLFLESCSPELVRFLTLGVTCPLDWGFLGFLRVTRPPVPQEPPCHVSVRPRALPRLPPQGVPSHRGIPRGDLCCSFTRGREGTIPASSVGTAKSWNRGATKRTSSKAVSAAAPPTHSTRQVMVNALHS